MSFKKYLGVALAATMTLSMASCAFAEEGVHGLYEDPANTQVTDETLVIGLSAEPSALWAAGSGKQENELSIISAALQDTLINFNRQTGEVEPALATAWEWVDDTHCKFTLRDDVTMTDGTPLVADDVVYTVNTSMEYSPNSDTGAYFAGAVADDEHTVTIEFTTVAPDLLKMLSWANFGIVSEDEVNAAGGVEAAAKAPLMGSGKYKFKEWNSGQSIVLERNDNYWDPDYKGYFKEIKFTFTNDAAARAMAVMSGDCDVAYDMPISMASTYRGNDQVKLVVHPFGQNTRIFYNQGEGAGATKDIKVRQAIDKALDFNAIAGIGTAGMGAEVHSYFPDDSPYYHDMFTAEERAQDIEGAKALLAEAGYDDSNPLELNIIGMQDQNDVFTVMQANLAQAGIKLNINIVDTPAFVEGVAFKDASYDIVHVGDLMDARYPASMIFFKQANIDTFVIGGPKYTTPEIEESIHAFISEPDEAKAAEMAKEIEQTFKDGCWYSNTYCELHAALTNPQLKGYSTIERGYLDCTNFYK